MADEQTIAKLRLTLPPVARHPEATPKSLS